MVITSHPATLLYHPKSSTDRGTTTTTTTTTSSGAEKWDNDDDDDGDRRGDYDKNNINEDDECSTVCPGKTAVKRLRRFQESWLANSDTEETATAGANTTANSRSSHNNDYMDDITNIHHSGDGEGNDSIRTLTMEDLHVDKLLGCGAFSTAHKVYLRNPITGHFDSEDDDDVDIDVDREDIDTMEGGNDDRDDALNRKTNVAFALKRLKHCIVKGDDPRVLKVAASDLALETKILANLHHENIIQLRGLKEGNLIENLKDGSFFIVLDLLTETLDMRLAKWKSMKKTKSSLFGRTHVGLTKRLQDVGLGIARGMDYLHSRNIMFRDLKPANIGFDRGGIVKIFDFGLAREYDEDLEGRNRHKPRYMTGAAGTPRYMAPEVARMDDDYGFPADVYSFSILLWQIVTNRTPYKKITTTKQFHTKVVQNHVRPSLSSIDNAQLKNLLEAGWCPHARERPTFSTIRRSLEMVISRRKSKNRSKRRLVVAKAAVTTKPPSVTTTVDPKNKNNIKNNTAMTKDVIPKPSPTPTTTPSSSLEGSMGSNSCNDINDHSTSGSSRHNRRNSFMKKDESTVASTVYSDQSRLSSKSASSRSSASSSSQLPRRRPSSANRVPNAGIFRKTKCSFHGSLYHGLD